MGLLSYIHRQIPVKMESYQETWSMRPIPVLPQSLTLNDHITYNGWYAFAQASSSNQIRQTRGTTFRWYLLWDK